MPTDLNIAPYFNDFSESKNYHQILFKPGTAVQSRELTEIQSILKNQIEKFGNHIFKQGSVVIPGNSNADIGVTYVTIETTQLDRLTIGRTVVGTVSGVRAVVRKLFLQLIQMQSPYISAIHLVDCLVMVLHQMETFCLK